MLGNIAPTAGRRSGVGSRQAARPSRAHLPCGSRDCSHVTLDCNCLFQHILTTVVDLPPKRLHLIFQPRSLLIVPLTITRGQANTAYNPACRPRTQTQHHQILLNVGLLPSVSERLPHPEQPRKATAREVHQTHTRVALRHMSALEKLRGIRSTTMMEIVLPHAS